MADLVEQWSGAVVAAGATAPADEVARAGRELLHRWREPHRHHHGEQHLVDVLDGVQLLHRHAADIDVVRLAAWFHDAVYDGHPGQDEELSAQLAQRELLSLGLPAGRVRAVAGLVRMTADHAGEPSPTDGDGRPPPARDHDPRDAAVLSDADLAVLAAPVERYARYLAGVRAEYAHVAEQDFRSGRARVLRRLLEQPQLFRTDDARQRWETAARRNLERELDALTGAPGRN